MAPLTKVLVTTTIKSITRMICNIHAEQLELVPKQGPLIIVCNHVNFLDVPIIFTHLLPRQVTGFAKIETWNNPLLGYLFTLWEAIPLRRGEADHTAIRRALAALQGGKIIAMAPEGTRSRTGQLGPAHGGIVTLASMSGAPILPLVYYGGEAIHQNLSRFRRTEFRIVVGKPFYIQTNGVKINSPIRKRISDEIMYQLAALLPPVYRGIYTNVETASHDYLYFPSEITGQGYREGQREG